MLGLFREKVHVPLSGLGTSPVGAATHRVRCYLQAESGSSDKFEMDALVLPRLTGLIPSKEIPLKDRVSFEHLALADSQFYLPARADVILGDDLYGLMIASGIFRSPQGGLVAQETSLGWIVSGPVQGDASRWAAQMSTRSFHSYHGAVEDTLQNALQQFWRIEEVPENDRLLKPEDQMCEDHFLKTHSREMNGRYVVRLPLRNEPLIYADETRRVALGSLVSVERRFSREPEFTKEYRQFMKEYEELGHMERVPVDQLSNSRSWYLPHHAVIQGTSEKRKIRVVFDASRRTMDQTSLNQVLRAGPPLQKDLGLILTNWRRWSIVFTADIVKMFRQINVHQDDQDLQRILWRPEPGEEPVVYRLKTVTYGTACAPYLAIRTLNQLAADDGGRFPFGARCLLEDTYVDDSFSGGDDLLQALEKRNQLINLLRQGGIELGKWAANRQELIPLDSNSSTQDVGIKMDDSVKTLGVHWSPVSDHFGFKVILENPGQVPTKRTVLSIVARLFDPLGWLAAVTVTAKILLQDLWLLKVDWDAKLPSEVVIRWENYCKGLRHVSNLTIDRWLRGSSDSSYELHAFSDASKRAYAAVVYLRVQNPSGEVHISLLAAKSKVSPVKTISIPNLELCGAALLVRLVKHISQGEFFNKLPVYAWSDSQVVLAWIQKHPSYWKTFVANRVCFIQTELPTAVWRYVPTKDNPADLASRGIDPAELRSSGLWWHGPRWLTSSIEDWPCQASAENSVEQLVQGFAVQNQDLGVQNEEENFIERFSSLGALVRAVGNVRRFAARCRRQYDQQTHLKFLTAKEIKSATDIVIRMVQRQNFSTEIAALRSGTDLPHRHFLRKLDPFVDENGTLRVGGRLMNSLLSYSAKHPAILPKRSHLSKLFIEQAHRLSLHGGSGLTANLLRGSVWIVGSTSSIKKHIRSCVTCHRARPVFKPQMMGNLPAERIRPARPFSITGVDYAGPFQIRTTKGRGHRSYKGYVSLFICFATRAIHLEVVSDMSSSSFLAAYRRFAGRRGVCHTIYSDNGTNFVGAARELRSLFNAASQFYEEVATVLAKDGTNWSFIPANAPHFGGLWEAGVKSVKHHLKRTIGEHTLTFEEFNTLLIQIEACLNSRPLSPLSAEPDSLDALTPAHFLIGSTLALIPEAEPQNGPENRLSRFQLIQRIQANFWKRWSQEYLHHLQERNKWRGAERNFAIGQLVIVRDDRYPPSKWPLGRVLELHPGTDGLVRVVSVRTLAGVYRHPVGRLSPLPLDNTS